MHKSRVITATLFILIVVAAIFFSPPSLFFILSSLIFLYGFWEWTKLAGIKTKLARSIPCLVLFFVFLYFFVVSYIDFSAHITPGYTEGLITVSFITFLFLIPLIFWMLMLLFLLLFPKGERFWKSKALGLLAGLFVLLPSLAALNFLRTTESYTLWILYLLIFIWTADIVAYYVGKKFGKHKLAPKISPGKTFEGAMGAFIGVTLLSSAFYYIFRSQDYFFVQLPIWYWLLLNTLIFIFSIVGDLFESAFKRVRHLKDSGQILPGHGGLLDRIDSLTAASPIFAAGLFFAAVLF